MVPAGGTVLASEGRVLAPTDNFARHPVRVRPGPSIFSQRSLVGPSLSETDVLQRLRLRRCRYRP
jgi:hypothetical protein